MEIYALSLTQLAQRLRDNELSSVEIVQALDERARTQQPHVNALVHRFREESLRRARLLDEERRQGNVLGPLHGLPFTMKESVDTEGVPSTLGLATRQGELAPQDAVVARVLRENGAILLAKTNVPQTLLSPMETTNFVWGTTNNPWNAARAPGGSSGGEAAALAAGMTPLGIGTDLGGSIRIPAAHCGVAGLKPTVDRWSNMGCRSLRVGQEIVRSQIGPMARSAADVAMVMEALTNDRQSMRDPRVPPFGLPSVAGVKPDRLRVGFYEDDGFFAPDAAARRAVRQAVDALSDCGVEMVEFCPQRVEEEVYLYFAALAADGGDLTNRALRDEKVIAPLKTLRRVTRLPRASRKALSFVLRQLGEERASRLVASFDRKELEHLWAITERRSQLQRVELQAWNDLALDAIVCPPHATPAVPHGASHDFTLSLCYAARFNLLNFPAGVVPVTRVRQEETERTELVDRLDRRAAEVLRGSAGLPVGVQVVARPYREDIALACMCAIEQGVRDEAEFPRTPVA